MIIITECSIGNREGKSPLQARTRCRFYEEIGLGEKDTGTTTKINKRILVVVIEVKVVVVVAIKIKITVTLTTTMTTKGEIQDRRFYGLSAFVVNFGLVFVVRRSGRNSRQIKIFTAVCPSVGQKNHINKKCINNMALPSKLAPGIRK